MIKKKYNVGIKNIIPICGLKKFINENPAPKGDNITENRKYALRALPIAVYNLAWTGGIAVGAVIGILKGLEALIK